MKEIILNGVGGLCRVLNVIAGVSLVFIMLLTMADVVLRPFNRPILGTYEVVSVVGVLIYGLAFPFASWKRQHIRADFLLIMLSPRAKDAFNVATRVIVLALFFWGGWNVMKYAASLQRHGEVSAAVHLPFYPFAYALGICCFIQCMVFLCELIKIFGRTYDEW